MKRGDSPTTEITNAAAGQPGYPAETESGETVFIISKERSDRTLDEKLTASDGRVFRPARLGEPFGLKPYDGEEGKDAEPVVEAEGSAAGGAVAFDFATGKSFTLEAQPSTEGAGESEVTLTGDSFPPEPGKGVTDPDE